MKPTADVIDAIREAFQALRPPPDMSVTEWAETYRVLSREDSAQPGRFSCDDRPYQRGIMDACSTPRIQRVSVVGSSQWGKALALGTPIPTPNGWTTMGDVKPGDWVFGSDGRPCQVIGESQVFHGRECFRVEFNDGSSILADREHLWYTEAAKGGPGVRSTYDIAQTLYNGKGRSNHSIPCASPIVCPEIDLPIPPYTFGAWLGDGDSKRGGITFGEDDRYILSEIEKDGIRVVVDSDPVKGVRGGRATFDPSDHRFCLRGHDKKGNMVCRACNLERYHHRKHGTPLSCITRDSFAQKLQRLGVFGNKKIPQIYLRASIYQRIALLQGLMDTDGTIGKNGVAEFTTISQELAVGVHELVLSIGLKAKICTGNATLNGRVISPKYRIKFIPYNVIPVFRLPRKLDRQMTPRVGTRPNLTNRRYISDVVPVPSVPVKCIAVDSNDNLYLAGREMIPTHNTQLINNIVGQRIHLNPGPLMVVCPTILAAEKWSKTRFAPMVRDCPELRAIVKDGRSSSSTILEKVFLGGILIGVGANAPAGLASQPIRDLLIDEVDRIPEDESAGEEGDFEDLAEARTADYEGRRLIFKCSTPTIRGHSRIEKSWNESDQRQWVWSCPHCGHAQIASFRNVVFGDEAHPDPVYACAGNGCEIKQAQLRRAILKGEWVAFRPDVTDHAGFHVHGLMVRTMSTLVSRFLAAKKKGALSLQVFINTQLGEWWNPRDGEAVQVEGLMARRETWTTGTIPDGVGVLTAAVDTQDDRLELTIIGWGKSEESWVVEHQVLQGNPGMDDVWNRLESMLLKEWPRAGGGAMRVRVCCLDIGGHLTKRVYQFCRRPTVRGMAIPVKGATKPQEKLVKRSSRKVQLRLVDTVSAKDALFARLAIPKPGPGYIHFPQDLGEDYYQQLLSEKRSDRGRRYDLPKGERNEALDLCVYNMAALDIYAPRDLDALVQKAQEQAGSSAPEPSTPEQAPPVAQERPERLVNQLRQMTRNRKGAAGW